MDSSDLDAIDHLCKQSLDKLMDELASIRSQSAIDILEKLSDKFMDGSANFHDFPLQCAIDTLKKSRGEFMVELATSTSPPLQGTPTRPQDFPARRAVLDTPTKRDPQTKFKMKAQGLCSASRAGS